MKHNMERTYSKIFSFLLLLLSVALVGCSAPEIEVGKAGEALQVTTSPYDTREYRALTLENGLRVLLVSDPETEKSAAALAVGVGSMQNPDEQLGLAHFLEHMLFLGTEKYPDPDEYSEFMSRHSGMHNAYTADDHTNYMFEVNNNALPEALDRFSDFFKAPLFLPEYVEKEVNAVHSEWSMQRANDGYILFALNNLTLNPEHPIARFRIGNNESLGDKENNLLLPTMLAFYQEYYSANLMTAAIAGNRSLDELEELARTSFSDIPNFQAQVAEITAAPATANELQQIIYYQPQIETRELLFDFLLPHLGETFFRNKPAAIVSYIIASEMPGTPAALLREAGFIESMSAWGEHANYGNAGRLRVHLSLTEQGYAQKELVIGLMLRYLEQLREQGVNQEYVNEVRTVLNNDFQFLARQGAFAYVSSLAAAMQEVPTEHAVDADYILEGFDADATRLVLEQLTPANMRLFVIAPDVAPDQTMHYFAGQYRLEKLSHETLANWENLAANIPLNLPAVNRFLPEHLTLVAAEPSAEPRVLLDEAGVSLLYQQSERFLEPRAVMRVNYYQAMNELSWEQRMAAQLLLDSFNLSERGLAREAGIAGVPFNLYLAAGLELSLSGFNDKQAQLAMLVMERFLAFTPSAEQVEQSRDRLRRQIENMQQERPLQRLFPEFRAMTRPEYKTDAERLAGLQALTLEQVLASRAALLSKVQVRAFVYGNQTPEVAKQVVQKLAGYATIAPNKVYREYEPVRAEHDFPLSFQSDTKLSDSALLDAYILPDDSMQQALAVNMLLDLMHTRFFNQLRTEEQLGYAVGVTGLNLQERQGLALYIQSPVRGTSDLVTRFDQFKADFSEFLAELSDERFTEVQAALRSSLIQPPQSLSEEAAFVAREWRKEQPMFDRRAQQLALIERITKADLQQVYQQLMGEQALRVRVEFRGSHFAETDFAPTAGWLLVK